MSDAGLYAELPALNQRILELEPTGHSEAEVRLRAYLLNDVVLGTDPSLLRLPSEYLARRAEELTTERGVDRYLLVATALYERTMEGGSSAALSAHLHRALGDLPAHDQLTRFEVWSALTAVASLADDELDDAETVLDRLTPAVARLRGGEPALQAELDHRRNLNAMRRGSFEDALTGVDRAAEYVGRRRLTGYDGSHQFTRAWIAFERGEYAAAGRLLADMEANVLVYRALGELLLGHPREAIGQLESYGIVLGAESDIRQIEVEFEPHLIASHAFQLLGDRAAAEFEADREVSIRREYGPRFRLAQALRRQAAFCSVRRALPLLEEAVDLAESTPRRPVQARVLTSYGAALARSSQPMEARAVLYRAIDSAADMGMQRLEKRARTELVRAGGRPRRARTSGPASLTEAQLRVAQLAARGVSNRVIAEQLFVTIKTVETHLQAVYRKLGIDGRDGLPEFVA
jgi:DNA-binding CsgD family transcriptional regulator